ncbi:elicitor-responsive 1 isoform X2 [Olea europaea subsp. europaea]|uniref:Elicitor-responsive 1 isoform X2 n=1 Tax=Olea europaea subsp. europaea TaxID=158383 RepID=A0A8S0V9T5_OLEEU|nr:elicitor-responsive 1 isoform X2 [Olea europaea subsp. europaea]
MVVGIMEVKLVGAKRLKNTKFFGRIDPYVLLQYRNQECKSSTANGQGRNPIWNENFEFRVDYPMADEQYKLVLKIMAYDTFTADDYLGQATIYVKELIELGLEKGKAELRPQKYRVVFTDKTYCGEIQVGVTFTAKVTYEIISQTL